jgi:hypothetical protein
MHARTGCIWQRHFSTLCDGSGCPRWVESCHPRRSFQPRRLPPRGFERKRNPEGGAGSGGVAVDGCVPNVDVEMSKQRHWPLPEPRARLSCGVLAVWLRPAGLGGPLPSTKTPPRWKEATPTVGMGRIPAAPRSFELAKLCRHGHRSPARPLDASRSPLGSGGTRWRISEVWEAGIDWRTIPAVFPSPLAGEGGAQRRMRGRAAFSEGRAGG